MENDKNRPKVDKKNSSLFAFPSELKMTVSTISLKLENNKNIKDSRQFQQQQQQPQFRLHPLSEQQQNGAFSMHLYDL